MDAASQIQILNKAVCVSLHANAQGKAMNLSLWAMSKIAMNLSLSAMSKIVR